ncbi:MAG TPA: ferredoxin-thioredoxin reductase catalytic domain-containing protein [Candidatus Aquicultor sp.]|jgi:ferredoxin-thioredoxin reductase catalytic subunit
MANNEISEETIDARYRQLKKEAEDAGYHLNPDVDFTKGLVRGLIINEHRYSYQGCPCRLASGVQAEDIDIICPCDYRDPDLTDYGNCYCALYVSSGISSGEEATTPIPERRPPKAQREAQMQEDIHESPAAQAHGFSLEYPVWRCQVCGYLCARNEPPEVCPICKAKKERFGRFI